MRAYVGRFDTWLAKPAPAERLAVFRAMVGTFTLGYLLVRLPVFISLADGRPGRFEPVGVLAGLDGPMPSLLIRLSVIGALAGAVAFTVGWRFRLAGPALALVMLLLGTYRSSWGQLLHFENLLVLHLIVLSVSPAADALSLDARRERNDVVDPAASPRYGWPLQLAALVTVITYVLAGLAKLRYGGIEWMVGDTLRNHIAYSATRLELLGGTPSPLADPMVRQAWLFPPLAVATVVIELGAPVALLGGRWRSAWAAAAWSMHAGILAFMLILFPYPLFGLAFAPLFRLERVAQLARRGLARRREPARV